MPRFAANLTFLFTELPLIQRFAAARAAGFGAVELLFPYDTPARDIRAGLDDNGLDFALMNVPVPDWAAGGRGCAALPGAEARFRTDFAQALDLAEVLNPGRIHIMAGCATGGRAQDTFLRNLDWAARQAPDRALTIEPINPVDMPGYFLGDFDLAARVLDRVGASNLRLQFDAYHAHRITGDVPGAWARHGARASHVQIAGFPGRHEPAGGQIDFDAFFARLDRDGYAGFVSAEYIPAGDTVAGLGWLARAQAAQQPTAP